jgi:Paraquat-inducible protein A
MTAAIANIISEEPLTVEQQHAPAAAAAAASAHQHQRSKQQEPAVFLTSTTTTNIRVRQRERRPGPGEHHRPRRPPPMTSFNGHRLQQQQQQQQHEQGNSISSRNHDGDSSSDIVVVALDTRIAAAASLEMEEEEEEDEQQHQQQQQLQQHHQQSSYFGYLFSSLQTSRHGVNNNNNNNNKSSLAHSPTTPCLFRYLIPFLSLVTHGIFLYGQLAPMWRLHLSVHVNDVYANATSYESKSVFATLGIPLVNHVASNQESNVQQFSFTFSITELWAAAGLPGSKVLPRLAAILLVLFSGVWPHFKLLLLQGTWWSTLLATVPERRTRLLHWLGTLGKWSLADVLAVCVMVGVLHLDWHIDPVAMKQGVVQNFKLLLTVVRAVYGNAPDICSAGLSPIDCHDEHKNGWDNWGKCKACMTLVNSAFDHPDVAQRTFTSVMNGVDVSGDGLIYLRVQGMRGIYAFCLAVILSILISLIVDILDVRSHHHQHSSHNSHQLEGDDDETDQDEEEEIIFQPNIIDMDNTIMAMEGQRLDVSQNDEGDDNNNRLGAPLLLLPVTARRGRRRLRFRAPPPVRVGCCLQCMRYLSLLTSTSATLAIVVAAVAYSTIARKVTGAIPQVLEKVLGVAWNRPYSLYSLVQTTGAAGGFDYLLMSTFGLFVVAGPVIRAILCVVAALTNTTSATAAAATTSGSRRKLLLLNSIEFVGAFCAWEVFAAAVFMVNLLMPAITSTIIMKPECAELDPESGSCLQVEFQLQDSFALLLLGGALLLFLANTKFGARNFHHGHQHGRHHARSASSESSSAAFEYSMVVQSESNSGGGMLENDRPVAVPTTVDDSVTLTSELV